jgi:hypothetical protein
MKMEYGINNIIYRKNTLTALIEDQLEEIYV